MNIVMITNTYLPLVGGVSRSVADYSQAYRNHGHQTLVVAPTFDGMQEQEEHVIRVPALQHFNGSDFSVRLPLLGTLNAKLDDFSPDVVHSHHPFLLGDTALRVAVRFGAPIVFTHHTMYERYTHYVPGDSTAMKRFAVRLATEYANLCHHVIAPSESIANVLRRRGVLSPITSIPTGIDLARFGSGSGAAAREAYHIPADAFLVGHVGRLAPEKNLDFLGQAVVTFCDEHPQAHFLVVGSGPCEAMLQATFQDAGLADRLHVSGALSGQALIDAYHAMDLFAFASQSETQGMVLAEALAAGVPVVAIDAPGSREIVEDNVNGLLLMNEGVDCFARAIGQLAALGPDEIRLLSQGARAAAADFSMDRCVERMLSLYQSLLLNREMLTSYDDRPWSALLRRIAEEWLLVAKVGSAAGDALFGTVPASNDGI